PPQPRGEHAPGTQRLVLHAPIERELRWGEMHTYEVEVAAGQVLLGTVDQRGVDLIVSIYNPDGKKLSDVDRPNGISGPEPVLIRARAGGIYRIEVRGWHEDPAHPPPVAPGAPPRRYEARIDEIVSEAEYTERLARTTYQSPAQPLASARPCWGGFYTAAART